MAGADIEPGAGRGPRPLLIAHRGASADYPENTAAAFNAALDGGCEAIELDLRPTADDQVVVCHDASLKRFGGRRTSVARQTLAQLQAQDVGSYRDQRFHGERLLSLEQLLERYGRRTQLLLELKAAAGIGASSRNERLCRLVVASVRRHRCGPQVMILCFSSRLLALVADLDPTLRLVRNTSLPPRPRRLSRWLARQPSLYAIDVDRRRLSAGLVAACHQHQLRIFTWSCNSVATLSAVRRFPVDGILSDRPAWLRTQVRAHG